MGIFTDDDIAEFRDLVPELKFHGVCLVDQATAVSDGQKGYDSRWDFAARIDCNIETGSLIFRTDTMYTTGEEPTAVMETKWNDGGNIKPPYRVKHKGDEYEVVTVEPPGDLSMVRRFGLVKRSF